VRLAPLAAAGVRTSTNRPLLLAGLLVCVALVAVTVTHAMAAPPTVSFTVSPEQPVAGEPATLTPSITVDPGRTVATVEWDLDGDNTFETTDVPATPFSQAGTFTVRLRVVDDLGESSEATQEVTVSPPSSPPTASFTVSPAQPLVGQAAAYTSTSSAASGRSISSYRWDFGADGSIEVTGQKVFWPLDTAGPHTVRLQVVDSAGESAHTDRVITVRSPPTASFSVVPAQPVVGQPVTFVAEADAAPGRTIANHEWDLNGASNFEPGGETAQRDPYSTSGQKTVSLRVTDSAGESTTVTRQLSVKPANGLPVTGFEIFPLTPLVGEEVTFVSYSYDPDGPVVHVWDLDGDGSFEQSGPVVKRSFDSPGDKSPTLRVTDSDGAFDFLSKTLVVSPVPVITPSPPPPSPGPPQAAPPAAGSPTPPPGGLPAGTLRPISPFPIVRLSGVITQRGATIGQLAVRAPKGARILVRCGQRCPVKRVEKTSPGGRVRFGAMERTLQAGTVLQVFVRQGGRIGKYTSFSIRRNRPPKRSDGCLWPGKRKMAACPAT
jgi:PKD repeat protein